MTADARVLRALRDAPVHLLPGDLAEQLSLTLPGVEASLVSLRSAGFDIESRPGFGIQLKASPDRILADDLWSRLEPGPHLREIIVFEETSSTNDVALRLGREGHPGGVVIFAERQTAGRGRFGRRWESADHLGLWFSWLLRPELPIARWPQLTTWAGVGAARALERFAGKPVQLKWPNDLQIHGRKVAGILIESAVDGEGRPFAVAGIGINVNQPDFPAELRNIATSARLAAGHPVDRGALAASVLTELQRLWPTLCSDFLQIVSEASARSVLLGHWVRLHSGNELIEGVAESLDASGQLLLRTADGILRTMTAGEVTTHTPTS